MFSFFRIGRSTVRRGRLREESKASNTTDHNKRTITTMSDKEIDLMLHETNVVRPRNHLWADENERRSWVTIPIGIYCIFPTYGTCDYCWASGPVFQKCIECKRENTTNEYGKQYGYNYLVCGRQSIVLDSQTIAAKLGRRHKPAKANEPVTVVKADGHTFNFNTLREQIKWNNRHIEDDAERERANFQGCNEFLNDYAPIHHKFMEDSMSGGGVRRLPVCVEWTPKDWHPEENKSGKKNTAENVL